MPTLTVYPDEHPETSSVDGQVSRWIPDGELWADLISNSGNNASDSIDLRSFIRIKSASPEPRFADCDRTIFLLDVSSLPIGIKIVSAIFSVYISTLEDALSIKPDICVYASSPNSNTALVTADYQQLGTTPFSSSIAYDDITVNQYLDFTLNTAGKAALQAAPSGDGIFKIGLRNANYDVAGVAPDWDTSGLNSRIAGYMADKGGNFRPRLVITYASRFPSAEVRVTGIRRIYRAGVYRMLLSLGEISDMDDIAGRRDYERYRHWWAFEPEEPPPDYRGDYPYPGDDPEKQWPWPYGSMAGQEPEDKPPPKIPRTGPYAVPYPGDDPEKQWSFPAKRAKQTKLPFPAPPPSFEPKVILEAPKLFAKSIIDFVKSFLRDW